jgi:hypothetical protein
MQTTSAEAPQMPQISGDVPAICREQPLRIAPSTWVGHVPFAMFLVDVLRPSTIVELGTQYGVSYCAFCQAVKHLQLDTRCYAVDTWRGEDQAGPLTNDVLRELKQHHDPLYGSFSELIQSTFDDARDRFAAGTVDLLHIDGYHTYEAVRNDFESWLPKLSDRGVLLFHDIGVKTPGFGVWQLWDELKTRYPSFEFSHWYGLGVLAVGSERSARFQQLIKQANADASFAEFFSRLGAKEAARGYFPASAEKNGRGAVKLMRRVLGRLARVLKPRA